MSDTHSETVVCPHCGHRMSTQVTTVIRHDDAKALEALFKGTLNRVRCAKCGHDFLVDTTLIYRDDENPFIVYYIDIPEDADLLKRSDASYPVLPIRSLSETSFCLPA